MNLKKAKVDRRGEGWVGRFSYCEEEQEKSHRMVNAQPNIATHL